MDAMALDERPRRLGNSSLSAFPIAYGCWRFARSSVSQARDKIETALETGINLFDHADIYGGDGAAESLFGAVLAENRALRDRMLIATKCGIIVGVPYDSSRRHIIAAAEASLRRLQIDVIDLYQIHRPDLLAHPHEIAAALSELRQEGKIREVGVSNYTPAQTLTLQSCLSFPMATTQPELSAWWLQPFRDGSLDLCLQHNLTPLPWSPLAGGKLGLSLEAARQQTDGERLHALLCKLDEIAAQQQTSRTAVALAFLLVHPAKMVPIIGTQQTERIRDSVAALRVQLTRTDWYAIFAASQGKPLP